MISVTILVPVYNNVTTLARLCKNLNQVVEQYQNKFTIEVLFVDDNSKDNSYDKLLRLKAEYNYIKLLRLAYNHTQLYSLYAALHYTKTDYIIYISADMQEDNSLIIGYLDNILYQPDTDLFIGQRIQNEDQLLYKLFSRLFYKIIRIKIPKIPIGGFDTACVHQTLIEKFILHYKAKSMIQAILVQDAKKIVLIPYKRKKSQSKGWRWQSRLENLKYFILCIRSVYFSNKKKKEIVFQIQEYVE